VVFRGIARYVRPLNVVRLAGGNSSRDNLPKHALVIVARHRHARFDSAVILDALVGEQPLLSHAFLHALHETGCATPTTGVGAAVSAASTSDALVGAMPLYLKAHSYGEYVFAGLGRRVPAPWAALLSEAACGDPVHAGHRAATAGRQQTGKAAFARRRAVAADRGAPLLVAHPVPGCRRRCAVRGGGPADARQRSVSLAKPGYRDFADFLSTLNHDKRKKIRQERRRLDETGVSFRRLTGADISASEWAFFYRCYVNTYRQHGSTPYLSLPFFERIGATMPGNVVLVIGSRHGKPVCAALDVFDRGTLWGRYWGATSTSPGMHFEACYYRAIEFCIERPHRPVRRRRTGRAQARGFLPVTTRSAHAIADPDFARAIEAFVARERTDVHRRSTSSSASPFRQGEPPQDPLSANRTTRAMRATLATAGDPDLRYPAAVTDDSILLAREGGIATLTLNRPDSLQLLDLAMMDALVVNAMALAADDSVRCIVIRGAGRHSWRAETSARLPQISARRRRSAGRISHGSCNACTRR
jgi:predicted N-acyltransferase